MTFVGVIEDEKVRTQKSLKMEEGVRPFEEGSTIM